MGIDLDGGGIDMEPSGVQPVMTQMHGQSTALGATWAGVQGAITGNEGPAFNGKQGQAFKPNFDKQLEEIKKALAPGGDGSIVAAIANLAKAGEDSIAQYQQADAQGARAMPQ